MGFSLSLSRSNTRAIHFLGEVESEWKKKDFFVPSNYVRVCIHERHDLQLIVVAWKQQQQQQWKSNENYRPKIRGIIHRDYRAYSLKA